MDSKRLVGLLAALVIIISGAVAFGQTPPPPPMIMATPPTNATAPAAYSFNVSGATVAYVNWNFGDGTFAAGSTASPNINVSHTFSVAPATGNAYKVTAMVYSNAGGPPPTPAQPYFALVTSASSPTVGVNITPPASAVAPASYTFTATTSVGTITYAIWNFSDGPANIGNPGASITHTFSTPGTFFADVVEVDLSGGGFIGDIGVAVQTASTSPAATIIGDEPIHPEGVNPQVGQVFQAAAFLTGGTISSVSWNFGDGTTGTGANVTHSYSAAGNYNLTATITPTTGPALTSQPIMVQVGNTASASMIVTPPSTGTNAPATFSFNATLTSGTISYASWNFGDGATLNGSTASPNITVSHTYNTAGTYNVTLTVVNTLGNTFTALQPVAVTSASGGGATLSGTLTGTGSGSGPWTGSGSYTASTTSTSWSGSGTFNVGTASGTWTGSGSFSGAGGSSGTWSGSGSWSTATSSGTWTGSGSWSGTTSGTWTGSGTWASSSTPPPPPPPGPSNPFITITPPASTTAPVPYSFGVQWPGQIINYVNWNFGDGSAPLVGTAASPNINVSHTYNSAPASGNAFKVTATTDSGATAVEFVLVTSAGTPTVNLIVTAPSSTVAPATYTFQATTSGGTISQIFWRFKDENQQTTPGTVVQVSGASTTYTFPYASNWGVKAVEADLSGGGFLIIPGAKVQTAASSPSATIIVNSSPTPIPPHFDPLAPVTGSATVQLNGGTISSVAWTFGDGGTATGTSVTHTYNAAGFYYINATVTPSSGAALTNAPLGVNIGGSPPPPPPTGGTGGTTSTVPQPFIAVTAPISPAIPATFSFTASLTNDTISSVSWDFGDKGTGTGISVNHTYSSAPAPLANGAIPPYNVTATIIGATGTYTAMAPITVTATAPIGAFIGVTAPASLVAPATYSFTANLQGDTNPISSVQWAFGDGATATGTSTTHTYSTAGSFVVSATITDTASPANIFNSSAPVNVFASATSGGGTTATSGPMGFIAVTPPPPPTTANPNPPPLFTFTANLMNDGANTISSVAWDFGDGTTNVGATISHTYNTFGAAGNIIVTATITDSANSKITTSVPIFVPAPPPTAPPFIGVTSMTSNGIAPATATLQIYNISSSNTSTPQWLFRDFYNPPTGGTGSGYSGVTHYFTNPGTYLVSATFTFTGAATSTTIYQPVSIGYATPPSSPAFFVPPATIPTAGNPTTFTIQNATLAYFYFGEGSSLQVGTGTSSVSVTHTYPAPGTYEFGAAGKGLSNDAFLLRMPIPVLQGTVATTTPAIIVNPSFIIAGQPVTLNIINVTTADWTSFGDGSPGIKNELSVVHTFFTSGTYNISANINGTTNSITVPIFVNPPPIIASTAGTGGLLPPPPPVPTISVTSNGTGVGSTFFFNAPGFGGQWKFGDGAIGSGNFAQHVYTTAGSYTVTFAANDPTGHPFTITDLVVVGASTGAAFTTIAPINLPPVQVTPAAGNTTGNQAPATLSFTAPGATTAEWNFGDGGTGSGATVVHTFTNPGNYIVDVSGTTSTSGGTNTFNFSLPVPIISPPIAGAIVPIITNNIAANAVYTTAATIAGISAVTAQTITNGGSLTFGGIKTTFNSTAQTATTATGINAIASSVNIPTGGTTGAITGVAGTTITAASTNLTAGNSGAPIKINVTLPTGSPNRVVWNFGNGLPPITGVTPNFRPSTPGTYTPTCTFIDPTTGNQAVVQLPSVTVAAPSTAPSIPAVTIDKTTITAGDTAKCTCATLTGVTTAVAYYRLNVDGLQRKIKKAKDADSGIFNYTPDTAGNHTIIVEAVLNDGTVIQSPSTSASVTASTTAPVSANITITPGSTTLTQQSANTFTVAGVAGTVAGSSPYAVLADFGNGVTQILRGTSSAGGAVNLAFTTPPLSVGTFTPYFNIFNVDATTGNTKDSTRIAGATMTVNPPAATAGAIAKIDISNLPSNVASQSPVTVPVLTANDGTASTKKLQFSTDPTAANTDSSTSTKWMDITLSSAQTAADNSSLLTFDPGSLVGKSTGTGPVVSAGSTFKCRCIETYTNGSATNATTSSAFVNFTLAASASGADLTNTTDSSGNTTFKQKLTPGTTVNAHAAVQSSGASGSSAVTFNVNAAGGSIPTTSSATAVNVAITSYGANAPSGVTPPDTSLIPNPSGSSGSVVASFFTADFTYTDGGGTKSTEPDQPTSIEVDLPESSDGTKVTLPSGSDVDKNTVTITHQNEDTGKMEALSDVTTSETTDKDLSGNTKTTLHISGHSSRNSPFALAGLAVAAAAGGGGAGGGAALGALAAVALCGTTGFDALIALGLVLWMNRYLRRRKMQRQQVK